MARGRVNWHRSFHVSFLGSGLVQSLGVRVGFKHLVSVLGDRSCGGQETGFLIVLGRFGILELGC